VNVSAIRIDASALSARTRRWLRLLRAFVVVGGTIILSVSLLTDDDVVPESPPIAASPAPDSPGSDPGPEPVAVIRPEPVHIRAASIGVDASLVPVGILEDDVMEVPEDVATIGWYDPQRDDATGEGLGVIPGVQGTAVLAGHVDSRSQGRGALYRLRDLRVGDVIEVDHADGTSTVWIVTEVIRYPKVDLPYHEVFTWSGDPRLALITCGGEFDRTERSYTDNIVAYAEPLAGSDGSPA
jgi:hypothetical protein